MTTELRFGAVVRIAEFPFTDQQRSKTAPAVVLSSAQYSQERPDVIVARVTSRVRHAQTFGAVEIVDWRASGLRVPSVIKPIVMTVIQEQVLDSLGSLDALTLQRLKEALRLIFPAL
jgi:mRNA-degrading endonuclease toxin of MazEF toxin-antitoxin module